MKSKYPLILFFVALGITAGYGALSETLIRPMTADGAASSPAVNRRTSEGDPTDVVERFFDGATKDRSGLVRAQPESFLECLWKTVELCRTDRTAKVARTARKSYDDDSVVDLRPRPQLSVSVEDYLKLAESGDLALVRIIRAKVAENEARVSVELNLPSGPLFRDFLLFRENDWRIFEICRPGEHPNFVAATEPAPAA